MINTNWPIKSTDSWLKVYNLRQSFLESEERYLGDGFFPREAQWFEIFEDETYNEPEPFRDDKIASFSFSMSFDTKQYTRSVYSILDFLGDVGGLLSILLPIGGAFISLLDQIFDRTLDSYLISKVFYTTSQSKRSLQEVSVREQI